VTPLLRGFRCWRRSWWRSWWRHRLHGRGAGRHGWLGRRGLLLLWLPWLLLWLWVWLLWLNWWLLGLLRLFAWCSLAFATFAFAFALGSGFAAASAARPERRRVPFAFAATALRLIRELLGGEWGFCSWGGWGARRLPLFGLRGP
jgi:hypothetical protein